ncbi:hypothetical protein NDU88_003481 [Pleurodeles waltl]|uniref:Uncharacterized protein n=1 Tax=Pleurodeles waltl TaxID=8319 RepID=A0AAV7V0U9_PLEWA|nr:hypothetical protein NDU88_003481 [Pleurodeles waltl]
MGLTSFFGAGSGGATLSFCRSDARRLTGLCPYGMVHRRQVKRQGASPLSCSVTAVIFASCRVFMLPCTGPPSQIPHTVLVPSKGEGGPPQVSSGPSAVPSTGTPLGASSPRFSSCQVWRERGATTPLQAPSADQLGRAGAARAPVHGPSSVSRILCSKAASLQPDLQARSARPRHQSANTGRRGPPPAQPVPACPSPPLSVRGALCPPHPLWK